MGWLLDVAVILAYFTLIIWVGLSRGKKETNLKDFALAGRRMPWWAVLGSIVAAETSAGTFVGTPIEGYTLRNYTFLQLVLGAVIGRVIVGYLFIPAYFRLGVYSIYEFLEARFGPGTKNWGSAIFLFTRVLAIGTRLYIAAVVPVLAFRILWGEPSGAAGEVGMFVLAIGLITILTAIYTTIGGIKAVIWTDIIQATLMMGCGCLAIAYLYSRIDGGWEGLRTAIGGFDQLRVFSTGLRAGEGARAGLLSVLTSDYTIFSALIGYTFTTMATHGTDQDMVQRLLTAPNVRDSRRSLLLSGALELPIFATFLTVGILLYAFYQQHPDPLLPKKSNEIFGHFILHNLPAGLRGMMLAGILATAMGSLSAALNALATSFVRDWYIPYLKPKASEAQVLHQARFVTVIFALILIAVGAATSYLVILSPKSRIIPIALGALGFTYGSLLGIFLLGALTRKRGSDRGNGWAVVAGIVVVALFSGLGTNATGFPVIAFPWRILLGVLVTFGTGCLFRTPTR
jgi:SSS family solute:Na+ symporter